ncbi:MAG: hypothetical protein HY700_03425, partial [Gemmatimonadetes bacterium]|nr:hypothetical protein [Gemmatimonadota bacterium]
HMNCSEFLRSYSEYRDGLIIDAGALRQIRLHIAHCAPCYRYDESVRRGVRALGEIDPSPDFRRRLIARVNRNETEPMEPIGPGAASVAAALMLAAAVALVIYSRRGNELNRPVPVAAATVDTVTMSGPERAFPLVVANPGVPFVTFTDLPSSSFHVVGSTQFHSQGDIPLGTWANLPH